MEEDTAKTEMIKMILYILFSFSYNLKKKKKQNSTMSFLFNDLFVESYEKYIWMILNRLKIKRGK